MKRLASMLLSAILAAGPAIAAEPALDNSKMFGPSLESGATQPLTREEEELEEITTDTGTYQHTKSAVESLNNLTADQREALKKAEKFYREAVISYKKGDAKASSRYYMAFIAKLEAANLGPDVNYVLSDEYDKMFSKINMLLCTASDPDTCKRYTIPMDTENETVKKYIKLFSEGEPKERINRAMERMTRYSGMIQGILREYGLPQEIIYLPIVESLYHNNDLSSAGALGIWQIMPHRGRALNLKINYWIDERKDPEKATRAAAEYLRDLFLMFDDWHLALAAYNRGEYGLGRDLRFSQATNIGQMSDRKAVPKETEKYVPQFIAATVIAENYRKYGFNPKFEEPPQYDEVVINNVMDLKIVAECAGATVETIRELNPQIMAWCTPHNYPDFKLKLPKGTKDMFQEKIALVKDLNPSRGFIRYKVVKGDWLEKIAKKFSASITTIREDNKIKKNAYLRIGQVLIIRPGRKYFEKSKNL